MGFIIKDNTLLKYNEENGVTEAVIPDSVTSIKNCAFEGCSSLTSITIPASVTSIGDWAFYGCSSLSSITIPDSVTEIGFGAFYGCNSLSSVTIPDSVTSIGWSAFEGCKSLTSITIPDSVTSIGDSAFAGCSSLSNFSVSCGNRNYICDNGIVYDIDRTNLICCLCGSKLENVTIPHSVTSIKDCAFEGCSSLTSVTIPDSVTSIGDSAFENCSSLSSITIPDSVTSIGYGAFKGCKSLTSITIPASVTSIKNCAFEGCSSLTSITIPDSVTSIGDGTFDGCSSLTSITIPDSVTNIGYWAFANTPWLKNYPNDFVVVGNGCLIKYKGKESCISIPDSFTSIGDWAFYGCKDLKITIEICSQKITIDQDKFDFSEKSAATEMIESKNYSEKLNHAVKYPVILGHYRSSFEKEAGDYIKKNALNFSKYAVDRKSVDILKEIEGFGFLGKNHAGKLIEYAFEKNITDTAVITYLLDLKEKTSNFTLDEISKYLEMFAGNVELTAMVLEIKKRHFTDEKVDKIEKDKLEKELGIKGRTLTEWKKIYTLENDDKNGGYLLKSYKDENKEIIIPDTIGKKKVTAIGEYCFSPGQHRLSKNIRAIREKITSVLIPECVKEIGDNAFYDCKSLTSINIPDSVTSIGDWAFFDCSSLTSITIPDSVTSIGDSAFVNCSSLTSVTIPDSVTSIEEGAFCGCSSLTSITIPDSVTSIEGEAFSNCSKLTSITIPDSVTYIGYDAFESTPWLKNYSKDFVIVGNGCLIKYKGKGTCISIPDSVTNIGYNAFKGCKSITSVTIPDSVTSIGCSAFEGCTSLTSVTIPNSVTSIELGTFAECKKLTSITIPDSVNSIEDWAFYRCKNLTITAKAGSYAAEYAHQHEEEIKLIET